MRRGMMQRKPAHLQSRIPQGTLHVRKCPLGHFREFVMTLGYEEFVGINILDETTMKSLFEQYGGTYRKNCIRQQAEEVVFAELIYN